VQQRRIVITGVNRGLGRQLAKRFVERGHLVWGTSRNGDAPRGVMSCAHLDLRNEASIIDAARHLGQETDGIDLLINSAGADARSFGSSEADRGPFDFDAATFNAVLDVNVTGPMLVTRHLLPLLKKGSSPMIVNVCERSGKPVIGDHRKPTWSRCSGRRLVRLAGPPFGGVGGGDLEAVVFA
jgi:NAD(P)-dependent dehydrogenase (short-subunit alcohol dehydrogenase family)